MKVTLVGIVPNPQMVEAGVPQLTPELLAATGARYSRNGDGLDAIMEKTAGMDPDQAVDSIFKFVDYGHQSIADMVPVAMFMDRVSMYLVMKLWHWCPTASGQESSTRYIQMGVENTVCDIDAYARDESLWRTVRECFAAYQRSLDLWSQVAELEPSLVNLPADVRDAKDAKTQLVRSRMLRNFAFDRSRYYLPLAAYTNVMMVMPARGWVELIQRLLSDEMIEAVMLGTEIRDKLAIVAPRLVKHAAAKESIRKAAAADLIETRHAAMGNREHGDSAKIDKPFLVVYPGGLTGRDVADAATFHVERYDGFGEQMGRVGVRFGWGALPIGEIRDLNRHRTGHKYFPLAPIGLYLADDEILSLPESGELGKCRAALLELRAAPERAIKEAMDRLDIGYAPYVYWLPLGTQCRYEHLTTADKFLYQCQLRTGKGAHYQYARRMREVLEIWHQRFPGTRKSVKPGTAEPE